MPNNVPYKYLKDENFQDFYPMIGASSFDEPVAVSDGGTGADTAAGARANLGAISATDAALVAGAVPFILDVAEGGTGANNAADARANLGIDLQSVAVTQVATMDIKAKSDGNVIIFGFGGYQASTSSGSTIGTVGEDYRPANAQWFSCTAVLGSSSYAVRVAFDTDGTLKVYDIPSAGTWSFGGSAIAFL